MTLTGPKNFLKAPWEMVIRNWNAQPVFGGGENEPVRSEKEYSRESLSLALTQWSLAQQKNMRSLVQRAARQIVWIVGERDEKYVEMSRHLQEEIPGLRVKSVRGSSHRVLFDNPKELSEQIRELL